MIEQRYDTYDRFHVVVACWRGELLLQIQKSAHGVLMQAMETQETLKAPIIEKVQ